MLNIHIRELYQPLKSRLRKFAGVIGFCCMVSAATAPAHAWPITYPTGTTLYNADRAFNGYTLFTPISAKPGDRLLPLYLINMAGDIAHQWNVPFSPLQARLLPNGNLIVIGRNDQEVPNRPGLGQFWMGGTAGWLVEMDWAGKTLFQHVDLNMHHDVVKLENGNYVYAGWEQVPANLRGKVRGGIKGSEHPGGVMFNDYLVEVNPQGKTVWKWHANQHLDPDIDILGPLHRRQEWAHINGLAVLKNGDIAVSCRSLDSVMIINKQSGRITFRWGNAAYLDKSTGRIEYRSTPSTMGGPHDVRQIPDGYPGAGNLTCFDNGMYISASRAVEIDPATGRLVWQSLKNVFGRRLYSDFLGGAQKLPNGNMFICDGINGRFLQMTNQQEVVWEYISPHIQSELFQGAIFKAHQYAPDHCPQMSTLQPAQGTTVLPPTATHRTLVPAQQSTHLVPALCAALVLSLVAAALLWRQLARERESTR